MTMWIIFWVGLGIIIASYMTDDGRKIRDAFMMRDDFRDEISPPRKYDYRNDDNHGFESDDNVIDGEVIR